MKWTRKILIFYVDSSLHVALSVVAFTWLTCFKMQLNCPLMLFAYVFFGALTAYNFIKSVSPWIAGIRHLGSEQHWYLLGWLLPAGIWTTLAFVMPVRLLVWTLTLGALTFFYAVPLINHKTLRAMPGVKVVIVAFVWAGVTVGIPVVYAEGVGTWDMALVFAQRMLLVMILMIPFELRDMAVDAMQLKTLPQRMGIRPTKRLGMILLGLALGLEVMRRPFDPIFFLSFVMIAFFMRLILRFATVRQSRFFASFWVEGIPVLWGILVVILRFVIS